MRKLPIYLVLLAALVVVVELLWHTPLQKGGEAPPSATVVKVVDAATGAPLGQATVTRLDPLGTEVGAPLAVDATGSLDLAVSSPRLVRVAAPGYRPTVQAVGPAEEMLITLAVAEEATVSVRFGGTVMMGRGLYAERAVGGPLLPSSSDVAAHQRLLSSVAPILADADLSVVTLGSPLVADPYVGGPRPLTYHPDRSVVLASSTVTAVALDDAGVDVVNLATDHAFDALQPGLDTTLESLDDAGLLHFGAGDTVAEAWQPAYAGVPGQTVAFIGCTTIGGERLSVAYVAGPTQGGAARCSATAIQVAVADALTEADDVVVFLNGGPALGETTPEALESRAEVTALARVAAGAGAAAVVGNHSPIIKPVQLLDGTPYFEATGDLVSDVRRWSALHSTIPQVVLGGGEARTVSVDPIGIVNQRPVPVVGTLADAVARRLTSTPGNAFGLSVGVAHWPALGVVEATEQEVDSGEITSLPAAWVLDQGQRGVRAGRDLLWGTGSMEDLDTDPEANGSTMWALGKYVTTSLEAGCHGAQGLRLRRGPLSAKDVVISPQYRQPVHEGELLTLTANVRLASEGASLEVRWYRSFDPTKRSSGAESVTIEPHELRADCAPVRLDLVVPEGMVAAQPYVRLSPRHDINLGAELRVDDVRLIRWAGAASGGRAFDTYETTSDGAVGLSHLGLQ